MKQQWAARFIVSKQHSRVELITNSSTVIFTVQGSLRNNVLEILELKCQQTDDMDWFNSELTVSDNDDGTVEIYSFLNDPCWFCDFVNSHFNIIKSDYLG